MSAAEALIKEARQRHRRRLRTIALVLAGVVAAGIGLALIVGGPSRSPRTNSSGDSTSGASSGILRGANTTVVVWPGTAQCCEQGNKVYVDDLTTGKVSLLHVAPFSGGDIPYSIVAVERSLVYLGSADNPGVWAIRDDFKGRPRLLGDTTLFAPSALPDHVWLIDAAVAGFDESVRSASMGTGRLGPTINLPKGSGLIEGTRRGLSFSTPISPNSSFGGPATDRFGSVTSPKEPAT